jgi:integrase
MPIRSLMTWVESQNRWTKTTTIPGSKKRKTFSISARQLSRLTDCRPTMAGSVVAANAWWKQRQSELSSTSNGNSYDAHTRQSFDDKNRQLRTSANASTVITLVEHYKRMRLQRVDAGQLSPGRFSWEGIALDRFAAFAGEQSDINGVNGETFANYHSHLLTSDLSAWHVRDCMSAARMFLQWCWETDRLQELPKNIRSHFLKTSIPKKTPPTFSVLEVRTLLDNSKENMRLYLLLFLNCGMTQGDVSDIHPSEFDVQSRTITRKRSKTKNCENVPTVTYPLWKSTFDLLVKHKSSDPDRLLLNSRGKPLKQEHLNERGRLVRDDYIALAFRRYVAELRRAGVVDCCSVATRQPIDCNKPPEVFRKTGANLIRGAYGKEFSNLYLGHSPRDVQDASYSRPSQAKFSEAIDWLGRELGVA